MTSSNNKAAATTAPVVETPAESPVEVPKETPPSVPSVEIKYKIDASYNIIPIDPKGDKKIVLLTIDDGPKALKTLDPILKAMADENVHAIFFVIGNEVTAHPEYLQKIADAGHTIGNHTWDHPNLKKLSNDKINKELEDTTSVIYKTLGILPQFFRPPYGAYTDYLKTYVNDTKMVFMTWSEGSEDWITKYQTKDAITKHVIEGLHPGANILMHEVSWTAEAMPEIIKQIKAKGYTIVEPKEIETL